MFVQANKNELFCRNDYLRCVMGLYSRYSGTKNSLVICPNLERRNCFVLGPQSNVLSTFDIQICRWFLVSRKQKLQLLPHNLYETCFSRMSGPFAVVMSYTSEFHDRKHRATVMMIVGTNFSLAALVLPVLAISILPHQISVEILSLKSNLVNFLI